MAKFEVGDRVFVKYDNDHIDAEFFGKTGRIVDLFKDQHGRLCDLEVAFDTPIPSREYQGPWHVHPEAVLRYTPFRTITDVEAYLNQ